jgi:excisionase family DNA binding protein
MERESMSDSISEINLDAGQLLSRRRVAAILDISIETVGRKIRAGDIKSVKLGRLVRVPRAEVLRLIAGTSGSELGRVS